MKGFILLLLGVLIAQTQTTRLISPTTIKEAIDEAKDLQEFKSWAIDEYAEVTKNINGDKLRISLDEFNKLLETYKLKVLLEKLHLMELSKLKLKREFKMQILNMENFRAMYEQADVFSSQWRPQPPKGIN